MRNLIYSACGIPVFQNVIYETSSQARSATIADVQLVQCTQTGLVYNQCFDPALVEYNEHYQNEQAYSPAFKDHLENVLQITQSHFRLPMQGVEIGCGKGHFLELARSAGLRMTGYDPAYQGTSENVVTEYYNFGASQVSADYFVMRHVLEHIPEPWQFLGELSMSAKQDALIYIEVPAFEWIVEHRAYYDIFYEHCNYFTLEALRSVFGSVIESGYCFGDQYLYVVAPLSSFQKDARFDGRLFKELDFSLDIESMVSTLRRTEDNYIWGAGAKGVTMSNLLVEQGVEIRALIDINPFKQGRYTAKSAIPIVSPDDALPNIQNANVLIMNPNYASEISEQLKDTDANKLVVT
ncbi:MAG: class I SAM-dependent methyltransferase [Pseudomonadota bacterium]